MAAAEAGHVALIPLLAANGAELDKRDEDGATAFLYACEAGQAGC